MKEDRQTALWDVIIENDSLEALLDDHQRAKVQARAYAKYHKDLKKRLAELKPALQPDVRYRIGRFVITPAIREGGGVEIPDWRTTSYKVKAID